MFVTPVRNVTTQREDTNNYTLHRTLYDVDCKKKRYKLLYFETLDWVETFSNAPDKSVYTNNLNDENLRWSLVTETNLSGYFLYKNLCTGIRE